MHQIFSEQIDIMFKKTVFVTVAAGSTSMGRYVSFLLHWTKAQQALPRCQYLSSKVHF